MEAFFKHTVTLDESNDKHNSLYIVYSFLS